ncbi:MAG: DUF2971 domain-containing protein [Huintestinicola sp.]
MINDTFNSSTVFHYTSEAGLMGILGKNKMKLHFTKADSVNDINEGTDIIKHLITALNNLKDSGKLSDSEYNYIKSNLSFPYAPYIFNFSSEKKKSNGDYGCLPSEPYIMCFSEEKDSLPMWNYYCSSGQLGYSLEIDINYLQNKVFQKLSEYKVDFNVGAVEYSDIKKVNFFTKEIDEIFNHNIYNSNRTLVINLSGKKTNINEALFSQIKEFINKYKFLVKDSAFMYEKEIRAIISVPNGNESFQSKYLNFKTRNGYLIPYLEITIDEDFRDIVKSVRIGPLANYELAERNLKMYLNHNGYTELAKNIVPSDIPIRF